MTVAELEFGVLRANWGEARRKSLTDFVRKHFVVFNQTDYESLESLKLISSNAVWSLRRRTTAAIRLPEGVWPAGSFRGILGDRNDQTTDQSDANVFQGMLNNVVETQWLNHQSMGTLRTATGWFQFSDPNVQPMFAVSYLDNQRVPKVETSPPGRSSSF